MRWDTLYCFKVVFVGVIEHFAMEGVLLTPMRSVPALSVIELVDSLVLEGITTRDELGQLGLSVSLRDTHAMNYSVLANERVPEHELVTIWDFAVNEKERPDIGLRVSSTIKSRYRGPLAKLILHSATIGQALELFIARHKWAHPGDNWDLYYRDKANENFTLSYNIDNKLGYPRAFVERNMAMIVAWVRTMTGQTHCPLEACFSFPVPSHQEQFEAIFGAHCQFNAPENCLTFSREILDYTNVRSDPYLFKLLHANHDDLMNNYFGQFQIVSKSKQEILSALPTIMTIEELSEKLNMSRSSLYRRLKEHGTNYSEILKDVRMQLAKSQLQQGSTVAQVAYSLGFADTSAFQKWFKTWFTESPGALKEKWGRQLN